MIILHATINIKPGKREEAIPIFLQMEEATQKEEGCIEYKFVSTLENPDVFLAVELWENQAALESHFNSDHMALFRQQRADLVLGGGGLKRYNATPIE